MLDHSVAKSDNDAEAREEDSGRVLPLLLLLLHFSAAWLDLDSDAV